MTTELRQNLSADMPFAIQEADRISFAEFLKEYILLGQDGSTVGNPNATYTSYLQNNKVVCSLKSILTDFSISSKQVSTAIWWRSVLACPLSGREFNSCLMQNRDATTETKDIFDVEGIGFIIDNGMVYFKTKKISQKSAVLKALYHFQVNEEPGENDARGPWHEDLLEVPRDNHRLEQKKDTPVLAPTPESKYAKRRSFPQYIRQLYTLGIRSSGIKVDFWTPTEAKDEYLKRRYLCRNPTMIFCKIVISSPVKLSAISPSPAESKSAAFKLAVDKITDDMEILQPEEDLNSPEASDAMKAIMGIYHDAIIMQHINPPSCSIRDIFEQGHDGFCHLYLYELDIPFLDGCGSSKFGLLFQFDDEAFHTDEDIAVSFPLDNVQDIVCKVELKNQTLVKVSTDSLEKLASLNTILQDAANYGRSKKAKFRGPSSFDRYKEFISSSRSSMKTSFHERTYLITPIQVDDQKHSIDWTLVSRIMNNDLQSFEDWKKSRSPGTHAIQNIEKIFAFQSTAAQLYIVETSKIERDVTAFSGFPNEEFSSYCTYYEEAHGIKLDHPELPLIPARKVVSLNKDIEQCINSTKDGAGEECFLVQELTLVLPLPWKLIMMYSLLPKFAPPMERVLQLRKLSHQLSDLCTCSVNSGFHVSLDNIEEATTFIPCIAYERLEHLGDAVLGFFVAINCFAHNSSMLWDDEDLGELKMAAVRNKALKRSGLACGVDRIIWQGNVPWKTSFRGSGNEISAQKQKVLFYNQIPEVVESLIGAAFMCDANKQLFPSRQQYTVIGFLEQLRLPMNTDCVGDEKSKWFKHPHSCIDSGFDFHADEEWRKQFEIIAKTFQAEPDIKLRLLSGVDNLLSLFRLLNPSAELRISEEMKVVMACAIFNDGFESDSDDSLQGNPPIVLARFRENLFFVGESALHLALTMECCRRYPLASAGDLHMLKSCCIADDAISYIVIKSGMNSFFYDQDSDNQHIQRFKIMVDEADRIGRDAWKSCRGWVLGREEFSKRWKSRWWANDKSKDSNVQSLYPQYAGLGGGCLYGQNRKVGKLICEDMVYSFKSIIGAMVLLVGLEGMWNACVPLFEEILLLSPEETRECYKNSITSTYAGKKAQSIERTNHLRERFGTGWSAMV